MKKMNTLEKLEIADKVGDIASKITLPAVAVAFVSHIAKSPKLATISTGIALLSVITERIADEIWMTGLPYRDEDESLEDFDDEYLFDTDDKCEDDELDDETTDSDLDMVEDEIEVEETSDDVSEELEEEVTE